MKEYRRRDPADELQRPVACNSISTKPINHINENVDPAVLKQNSHIYSNLPDYVPHLTLEQQNELHSLLHKHHIVFTDKPGICKTVSHDIELMPNVSPIRQSPYRLNPHKLAIMKKEVDYLLENGLAEPSSSPWASPSLLVPKEGGDWRFCTDFRKVNAVTVKDSYPLPRIDTLIDTVGKSAYLSKIDLLKGYYQIRLTPRAQRISAFVTPFGLYNYLVVPFGLSNAPATFQRAVNNTIAGLDNVYAYLDYILVLANTWDEHLDCLDALLDRLASAGFVANL